MHPNSRGRLGAGPPGSRGWTGSSAGLSSREAAGERKRGTSPRETLKTDSFPLAFGTHPISHSTAAVVAGQTACSYGPSCPVWLRWDSRFILVSFVVMMGSREPSQCGSGEELARPPTPSSPGGGWVADHERALLAREGNVCNLSAPTETGMRKYLTPK